MSEAFRQLVQCVREVQEHQQLLDFYTTQNPSLLIEPHELEEATIYAVLKDHVKPVNFVRGLYQTADPVVAAALLLFDPEISGKERDKCVIAGDWAGDALEKLEDVLELEPEPGPVEPVSEPREEIPLDDDVVYIFGAQMGGILAAAGYPTGSSLRALKDPALAQERAALADIRGIGDARLAKIEEYING